MARYIFPRWSNKVAPMALAFGLLPLGTATVAGFWYYGTNKHFEVGYQPKQPVEYSHKLHAGDLGIDCRYCHQNVERSSAATVPPTQTCMNCHSKVRTDSAKLLPVRESFATNKPIPWVRIHNLPDYVYFDHSAHMNAGVGCETCHGRIDEMIRVSQEKPLSMGWCLDCHRDPGPNLRPPEDITKMGYTRPAKFETAMTTPPTVNGRAINPPTNCSGCHR